MTHIKRGPSSLPVDLTRRKSLRKSRAPGTVETGSEGWKSGIAVSSFERFIDGGNKRREKAVKFLKHIRD